MNDDNENYIIHEEKLARDVRAMSDEHLLDAEQRFTGKCNQSDAEMDDFYVEGANGPYVPEHALADYQAHVHAHIVLDEELATIRREAEKRGLINRQQAEGVSAARPRSGRRSG